MKDKISTEEQNGNCSKQLLLDSAFTHIGLFEGIGGFSLASRWMGWETKSLVRMERVRTKGFKILLASCNKLRRYYKDRLLYSQRKH